MSSQINLDLDFHDYAPQYTVETGDDRPSSSRTQQQPKVAIKIPDSPPGLKHSQPDQNPIGGLLSSLTDFQAPAISDDKLIRMISATNRQKQHQQQGDSSLNANWGLNYLAQYFDVTTDDVLRRILWSSVPLRKVGTAMDLVNDSDLIAPLAVSGGDNNVLDNRQKSYSYMERFIQSRPDLYGPFWVSTTLIIAVAMFSNIASFLNFRSHAERSSANEHRVSDKTAGLASVEVNQNMDAWHYSMEELNLATSLVMIYTILLPAVLWFAFWFRGCTKYYTLMETICAYGYSLSIFIPCAALLMVQAILFRYVVLTTSWLLSGLVLMFSFLPIVKSDPAPAGSHILLSVMMACHFGLAYGLHRIMLQ